MLDLNKKPYTVKEVAEATGVHEMTVYRWIYAGLLKSVKSKTGRHRIYPKDLDEFLDSEPSEAKMKQS